MPVIPRRTTRIILTALLPILSACSETIAPDGGGGGGGGAESDFTIPPFNVIHYSTDFEGSSGQLAVGRDGVALIMTMIYGSWVLPTEDQTHLNDVIAFGLDSMFTVGDRAPGGRGVIDRFLNGKRLRMTHPLTGTVEAVHGYAWNRVYAVDSYGQIIRYNGSTWNSVYRRSGGGLRYDVRRPGQ
jgi:hypothetical protein